MRKLDTGICQKARLARDPRFDGQFFIAVTSTKIYCRPICPVAPPKEHNVRYYQTAVQAADAGFRPCLRCRPDSAPGSSAWRGVNTTLDRAIKLINQGALQQGSIPDLAERLGISDRYLRLLFEQHFGLSPKKYALYQQCLFAKQLLHQTQLSITDIALASGFNSIRRFNDCFIRELSLTPSQTRMKQPTKNESLQLFLAYRPPFDVDKMLRFYQARLIEGLEWATDNSYGRTFEWQGAKGQFTLTHITDKHQFSLTIDIDDLTYLSTVVDNIRRLFDLDADLVAIETDLTKAVNGQLALSSGIRLPGIWSMFEAGIRAILGQQISVNAAKNLVQQVVGALGEPMGECYLFPTPESIANSDLAFLKIPGSRKQTLINLASHYLTHPQPDESQHWLALKGIGPWTTDYAKMRGLSDPDIFLGGDLGVKKALLQSDSVFEAAHASPWQSYLTFQLWNQL
ncbi:AlkA N-terminal domain-containing protein [Pseudoalteromonas ulvae]|uniref:DNA-3-methyladenine glycosylase II n=1 Tax=Pseudoalteromonas ulvae TaxID=107327 RepID=A0A244CT42_PSEDV|nr:AlkA N-terminal domain-containing protein [Pseudoalteromonas ulvae]OUL58775.1 transcriptional regulator [Pseudoalteromonas ulvae]